MLLEFIKNYNVTITVVVGGTWMECWGREY